MKYLICLLWAAGLAGAAPSRDPYSVRDFGAKADGQTDDTTAFQKALDAAGQAGGGVVYAPRGDFRQYHYRQPSHNQSQQGSGDYPQQCE